MAKIYNTKKAGLHVITVDNNFLRTKCTGEYVDTRSATVIVTCNINIKEAVRYGAVIVRITALSSNTDPLDLNPGRQLLDPTTFNNLLKKKNKIIKINRNNLANSLAGVSAIPINSVIDSRVPMQLNKAVTLENNDVCLNLLRKTKVYTYIDTSEQMVGLKLGGKRRWSPSPSNIPYSDAPLTFDQKNEKKVSGEDMVKLVDLGHDPIEFLQYAYPAFSDEQHLQRCHGMPQINNSYGNYLGNSIENNERRMGVITKFKNLPGTAGKYATRLYMNSFDSALNQDANAAKLESIAAIISQPMSALMSIDITKTGDSCYFCFDVIDYEGNIIQRVKIKGNIKGAKVNSAYPMSAPIINAIASGPSSAKLSVSQTDPRASTVKIYKKEIIGGCLSAYKKYPEWKLVSSVTCTKNRDAFLTVKKKPFSTLIYRAVSEGMGMVSTECGTCTVKAENYVMATNGDLHNGYLLLSNSQNNDAVILTMTNDDGSITISLTSIQGYNIHSVRLVYWDITNRKANDEMNTAFPSMPLGVWSTISTSDSSSTDFIHKSPRDGHIYKYRAIFRNMDGTTSHSKTTAVHTYRRPETSGINFIVGNAAARKVGAGSEDINVTIPVSASLMVDGMQEIISTIEKNNAFTSFAEDIKNNRGRFKDLLKINVRRMNVDTGVVYDLGVHSPKTFIDNLDASRRNSNAPGPVRGTRYRYELTLLRTSIFDILRGVELTQKDPETLISYKQKVSKFLNSKTLRTGILPPSNIEFSNNDINVEPLMQSFVNGSTAVIRYVDAYVPPAGYSNIHDLSAAVIYPGEYLVRLSWSFPENDIKKVDHFQIYATYLSTRAIVGIAHPFGTGGRFEFTDKKLGSAIGKRTYQVIPVYNDYTVGESSNKAKALINSSVKSGMKVQYVD